MEERFKLIPKLSLSEMALRRVAVNLWYDPDISTHVERYGRIGGRDSQLALWTRSVKEIHEKVPKLMLPETLKRRLLQVVRPINTEVIMWHRFHGDILEDAPCERFNALILEPLQWTCTGAVDYRRTAEELLRLELFDVEKRYRLACLYCLEDGIPALWANLPEVCKNRFNNLEFPLPENGFHLEYYWASVMKGEEINLNAILPAEFVDESSAYLSFFRYSAHESSRAATEYFFQKLANEDRGNAAFRTLCDFLERGAISFSDFDVIEKARSEIFYYMLSIITREQRAQVFEKYPFRTVGYFMEWPFLDILLEVTDIIWKFLPECFYEDVLARLIESTVDCSGCFGVGDFPDLFLKIFIRSPSLFKQHFVDEECSRDDLQLIPRFIDAGDSKNFKVLWISLNSACRWSLLCHYGFFKLLSHLLHSGKWQLVEFCFRELSKADRGILMERYMPFTRECPFSSSATPDYWEKDWKLFFESFDETSASALAAKFSEDETQRKRKRKRKREKRKTVLRIRP